MYRCFFQFSSLTSVTVQVNCPSPGHMLPLDRKGQTSTLVTAGFAMGFAGSEALPSRC